MYFSKKTQMSGNCFRSSLPCSNHWKSIFLSHTWRCFPTHCTPLYKVNTSSHCLFLRRRTFLQHVCVKRSYCWSEISQRQAVSKWLALCFQFWCGRFFPFTPTITYTRDGIVEDSWILDNPPQDQMHDLFGTKVGRQPKTSHWSTCLSISNLILMHQSAYWYNWNICGIFCPECHISNDPLWDQRTMRSDDEVICVFCLCCSQKASNGI